MVSFHSLLLSPGKKTGSVLLETSGTGEIGDVFCVGTGDCGQLGLGPDIMEKEKPAKIKWFDARTDEDGNEIEKIDISRVYVGGMHNIAMSPKTGLLYSWYIAVSYIFKGL